MEELKWTFKIVYVVVSDKHVKNFIKHEHKPEEVQSQSNNVINYVLETISTDKCVPYAVGLHKINKTSGKNYRDIAYQELEKCTIKCGVFKGTNFLNEMLENKSESKGEAIRVKDKFVIYYLNLFAHHGFGFDTYLVLTNTPQKRTVLDLIKNSAGLILLKLFNGHVDQNKKFLNTLISDVEKFISNYLKKVEKSYKLQPSPWKQEVDHDENYEDTWEDKENEWLPYLKIDVLPTAFCYASYSKGMEELTGFGMKNSSTLASLANKYFNSLRDEEDEITFIYNDE